MITKERPGTTIDRETHTIAFERTYPAPRDAVFEAWTDPEQLALWWDPTGEKLSACEVDLRVGGTFRFENAGHSPPFCGVYQTVQPPERLVFEALGAVGTVTLEARGASTNMRVTIRCSSAEHLAQFLAVGVDANTELTFDNLGSHLLRKAG